MGDDPNLSNFRDPSQAWLGRFRNTDYPGDDYLQTLVEFLVERFNEHFADRLEICNFVDQDSIDFIEAFENYLTIDRSFRECLMIATTTDSAVARLLTFAELDKFHALCRFPKIDPGRQPHHMCNRSFLSNILTPAFGQPPSHDWPHLRSRCGDCWGTQSGSGESVETCRPKRTPHGARG